MHNKNNSFNTFAVIRCVSINELDHELMRYWILGDELNTNCNKNRYNNLSVIGS